MRRINKEYHVILIDNFDSFTHNLVETFQILGARVIVFRNEIELSYITNFIQKIPTPKLLVLSPGPGRPENAGCCINLVKALKATLPILGVCLGHQIIAKAFGATIAQVKIPLHGKATQITYQPHPLFSSLLNPMTVARYHSLFVNKLPNSIRSIAKSANKIMAIEHRLYPIYGLQFHPESILTPEGEKLLENLIQKIVLRGEK